MINMEHNGVVHIHLSQLQDAQIESEVNSSFEQALLRESRQGLEGGLLESISELKSNIDSAKSALQDNVLAIGDDPAKLLEMQWALTRITFQEELIAKTVGKTTQNIETLLKAQ